MAFGNEETERWTSLQTENNRLSESAKALARALRSQCDGCVAGLVATPAEASGHINPRGEDKFHWDDGEAVHDWPDGTWEVCFLTPTGRAALAAYDREQEARS